MRGRPEYGDYQTPLEFSERVCLYLKDSRHIRPSVVVEPTCGTGSFLQSSLLFDARAYYGIEINPEYCEICGNSIRDDRVKIINSDIFSFPLKSLPVGQSDILVLGNPPWVTNSALSALGSDNLPIKANFKGLTGIEAITGESNFDICESVILRLIQEYGNSNTVIAMLCKTSVARNIFRELKRTDTRFESCDILEFDAAKVFGIHASACLFLLQLSDRPVSPDACGVYDFEHPAILKSRFGFSDGQFYSSLDTSAENFDGECRFEWRQGVKHDCSRVMELTLHNHTLQNGKRERVEIESDLVFPLVKSSMFKAPVIHSFSKFVIVTQRKAREETGHLEREVPKTWEYLRQHRELFEKRKSVIYQNAPPFSMFGVGDYSYSRYKVGVSGFYKQPLFALLYADDGKPVMTDDTSYFICFQRYDMAYVAMLLLNSDRVRNFLKRIAFPDAKRPYTKKVLKRIDFRKITECLSAGELKRTEREFALSPYVTSSMYGEFRTLLEVSP